MPFKFTKCFTKNNIEIEGLYQIQPELFGDNRGYFLETYSKKDFEKAGITKAFVQDNKSKSVKGVLRGLHFQTIQPQGKIVSVLEGRIFDVAVDLRKGSKTFGNYYGLILDSELQNQLYIPEGFAHGFYVLSDYAISSYKCTDFYAPQGESGLMWNDPLLNIQWPLEGQPILSPKDLKHPAFNHNKQYFDLHGNWLGE